MKNSEPLTTQGFQSFFQKKSENLKKTFDKRGGI